MSDAARLTRRGRRLMGRYTPVPRSHIERGQTSEDRVMRLLEEAQLPPWALSFRRATRAEDRAGVDIVIETNHGPAYLQVKTTHGGAHRRWPYYRDRGIPVVVAGPARTDAKVKSELLSLVDLAYRWIGRHHEDRP